MTGSTSRWDPLHQRHPVERAVDHHRPRSSTAPWWCRWAGFTAIAGCAGAGGDRGSRWWSAPLWRTCWRVGAESWLREAASALGLPRSLVIKRIAHRAARAGLDHRRCCWQRPALPVRPRRYCSPRSSNQFFQPQPDQDAWRTLPGDHQRILSCRAPMSTGNSLFAWSWGLAHYLDGTCPEHWRPHPWRRRGRAKWNDLSVIHQCRGGSTQCSLVASRPDRSKRGAATRSCARPELCYVWREPCAEEHQLLTLVANVGVTALHRARPAAAKSTFCCGFSTGCTTSIPANAPRARLMP